MTCLQGRFEELLTAAGCGLCPPSKLRSDSAHSVAAMLVDDKIEYNAAGEGGETKGFS